jgi:hypothetical protein
MYLSHVLSSHAFFEKFLRQGNFKHHHEWRSRIVHYVLSIVHPANDKFINLQIADQCSEAQYKGKFSTWCQASVIMLLDLCNLTVTEAVP